MAPSDPSQSSGKQGSQGECRTFSFVLILLTRCQAVIMQLPAETPPSHPGIPGQETFKHCKTCDAQFEDYDERYGRVIQFCGFCGDRLVRSVLADVNNHIRPVNVSSVAVARTPYGPSTSSYSRSPMRCGGPHDRRSPSPHTRTQHDSANILRPSVSSLQGGKHPCSPTTDNISNSQGDKSQNPKHKLEPSMNYENKKAKIVTQETIVMGFKQEKENIDSMTIEGGAETRDTEVGESDVHHSRLSPREDTRRVQAVPQVKMAPDPLAHHQTSTSGLSNYARETVEQQREIERQIVAKRLRDERRKKDAKNMQRSLKEYEAEMESAKTEPTKTEPAKKKQAMIDLTMEDE